MGEFRTFLEASSIHGLTYISTTRSLFRIFWTLVVITGFTGAGFLIYESFQSWEESPVSTTVETLPITELTFPKVTVCPPRNTYTDLNFDIMRTEKMTLDDDIRDKLTEYAEGLIWNPLDKLSNTMTKMNKLQVSDRYYNWYHGYTKIIWHNTTQCSRSAVYPYQSCNTSKFTSLDILYTSALSGSISTQYFGEKFDAEKLQTTDIEYNATVKIHSNPVFVSNIKNANVTLNFNLEKISLKKNLFVGNDQDSLYFFTYNGSKKIKNYIYKRHVSEQFKPPGPEYVFVKYVQEIFRFEGVKSQKLDLMPGFRCTWIYTGMELHPDAKFSSEVDTEVFVR